MTNKWEPQYNDLMHLYHRMADVEHRLECMIMYGKVTDTDIDGTHQPPVSSEATGEQLRYRVCCSFTPQNDANGASMPNLITWARAKQQSGNYTVQEPLQVGTPIVALSLGGRPGLQNTLIMPASYSEEDGKKLNTMKFPPPSKKQDRVVTVVHVTEEEQSSEDRRTGPGAPEANTTQCKAGKPGFIHATCKESDNSDFSIVEDDQAETVEA